MKRLMFMLFSIFAIALFIVLGCSKKESPTSPAAPTATLTATFVPTSTPASSPNISGVLNLPASANGKQFIVIADDDNNTANGYVNAMYGICPDTTNINYSMEVSSGSYYVYAYVDVDNSGLNGPDGLDYFGFYNNGNPVTPPNNSVDITLQQLSITVTLNVTLPNDATGKYGHFGIFAIKDYSILKSGPTAGADIICPSGTSFQVTFTVNPQDTGTYYLIGFVDADGSCGGVGEGCFPQEGDYLKVYGGSGLNWPASPNVTINNDITLNFALINVVSNVSGTAYLPSSVNNKEYTIFVSTVPIVGDVMLITKTARASGSSVNYDIFVPLPGMHYITFAMDLDDSGWVNGISTGDYAGIYGVPTPILNWMAPFPSTLNANLPGSGFNIDCDTYPGDSPPSIPTPIPAPTPGGDTGTITVDLDIPSGQTNKAVLVMVDMDLDPTNGNTIDEATAIVSGLSQQFTFTDIPVGSYYIYAATITTNERPQKGDAVGIYGTTFPNFPSSPNANVTNGGNLNATIIMVDVNNNNISGRVYMPYNCPIGREWAVIIDTDLDGSNNEYISIITGTINNTDTYFDYSMFLPFPGNYYIYALVDYTGNGVFSGPNCGDFFNFYNYPNSVHLTPDNNYTNININTNDWMACD